MAGLMKKPHEMANIDRAAYERFKIRFGVGEKKDFEPRIQVVPGELARQMHDVTGKIHQLESQPTRDRKQDEQLRQLHEQFDELYRQHKAQRH